ncbi:MAG: class I tRNA ligase family protein, partial [Planctomycetales bacterium]|nr:class I tRNA ligase family protein [Planctomycetales bacterium]
PLKDGGFVEVSTTRPETILGDTAVAVHPDDERYAHLIGKSALVPILNREIPVIADEYVDPEFGTGALKVTPGHDPNDYEIGKRHELAMINIMNKDATLNDAAGPYAGLDRFDARKQLWADMEAAGLVVRVEERAHQVGHCQRCNTIVEPLLSEQWWVKTKPLAEPSIEAVRNGDIQIIPQRFERTYFHWMENIRDWCISRQLWWGHRIPIWSASFTNENEATELVRQATALGGDDKIATKLQKDEQDDGTISFNVFVCLRDEESPLEAKAEALGMQRDPDVLDTWFSSALWPHSTLGWPQKTKELDYFYPTSTLCTSRDIITLWVARMVLMGLNNLNEIPFHEVFIHPTILDGNGERMSKSKGNGVDPIDIIDKFGPDSLRFGLARLATETQDVRMPVQYECPHCEKLIDQTKKNRVAATVVCPECKKTFATQWAESEADTAHPKGAVVSEKFETSRNFVNKLWNAARFVLMNLEGYQPQPIDVEKLPVEDRWLLSRLATVTAQVTEGTDQFKFAEVARILYDFAWDEFCSFYVEIAKPRLADDSQRAVTQNVIAHGLDTLLRLLHPTMPFVTESIWGYLGELAGERGLVPVAASPFVMTADWPIANKDHYDQRIERQFAEFQEVVGAIRRIRASQNIAPRETVPVSIRCSESSQTLLEPMKAYFDALAGADVIEFGPAAKAFDTDAPLALPLIDVDVHVDLEKFIDVEAELSRLEKLLGQL